MNPFLIVNADDYGLTPGVSAGIREASQQGIVTSTTAMMNQPDATTELPRALNCCPLLGLGVHLNLTAGKPLRARNGTPGLVDTAGNFVGRKNLILHLSELPLDEVEAEWRAQIEKFVTVTGLKPDHLDAHHHSAYLTPALFELLLKLAAEYACPIRSPYGDSLQSAGEFLSGDSTQQFAAVQRLIRDYVPRHTQAFSAGFYDETATPSYLQTLLTDFAYSSAKSLELMVHPAIVDARLREISSYAEPRARELQILTSAETKSSLAKLGILLGSFRDL